jgi:hypothetical protein
MKKLLFFISAIAITLLVATKASIANIKDSGENKSLAAADSLSMANLVKLADAERVLGEDAHPGESEWKMETNAGVLRCSFVANASETKTKKTGALYVMLENHFDDSSARQTVSDIKAANQSLERFSIINDLGDEAFFHSDGQNFLLILARKGSKVVRLKVNKITIHTSLDNLHLLAREVVGKL